VSWGFRSRDVLEQAGPDRVIDRPRELLSLMGLDAEPPALFQHRSRNEG
jgi:hypothetical protein